MHVPLLDLRAQYETIRDEVLAGINEVLDSQRCIGGSKIDELEKAVAEASDCEYAVGVSSGTDAILNTLMSLDIGPGDEVITTPFTFFATVGCIARVCAKPVFVDIDPRTYNINPELIEAAITDKTKAVIPVHLFGQPADMDPIMAAALSVKLPHLAGWSAARRANAEYYNNKFAGTVPVYPELTDEMKDYVAGKVLSFLQ
ncbi:MAG: hypothetical protein DRP66_02145 [Planctomycetota bacterium]|nr:MAG: hypothetical protein DRP66_02145 [Planctomycetota bacterium]